MICYGKCTQTRDGTQTTLAISQEINLSNTICRDSADGRYVPNEVFFYDIVVEDPNSVSTSQSPDSAEEPEGTNDR